VIEFDQVDLDRAKAIAQADRRSVSFVVRYALHQWLKTDEAAYLSKPFAERLRANPEGTWQQRREEQEPREPEPGESK